MEKSIFFERFEGRYWPESRLLKPFFFGKKGQEWFDDGGNDTASITLKGLEGTGHLDQFTGRKDISLSMCGNQYHGVFLMYEKRGPNFGDCFSSKGDMTRIHNWVRTLQNDLRPIGLYIPFPKAWLAVKEFMETEGQLPKSIEWVANRDLPPDTFPVPHAELPPGSVEGE